MESLVAVTQPHMNMQRVKASCDIQSLCVPFPAGQWGSHNKQQPKKIMCYHGNFSQNQKRMKRKREAPQKQTDRIKGSLWPFCLPALKWGARGEVEFWKTRDQSRKKRKEKKSVWSQNEQERRERIGAGKEPNVRFDFSIWLAFKSYFD